LRKPSNSIKERVAKEAAVLLYTEQEKEYKQAKQRAADTFGVRTWPSNKKVAEELDKTADEIEGPARKERLAQMRKDALSVMVVLGDFHPRLVGSVWRGTAHRNSDIDIEIFTSEHKTVLERLKQNGFAVQKTGWQVVTKGAGTERAFHVYLVSASLNEVELVVRSPEKINEINKCEIYGDIIKGLNIHQLRRVLLINPIQKFAPARSAEMIG